MIQVGLYYANVGLGISFENAKDGADVAIHLPDNRVIYAHQVVLTSRSRYFRGLCCNELVQPKPPAT